MGAIITIIKVLLCVKAGGIIHIWGLGSRVCMHVREDGEETDIYVKPTVGTDI